MTSPAYPPDRKPCAVLDTNVVLDWLVFQNSGCLPLASAIETGQLRWITTIAFRNELSHVLSRGGLAAWAPDEAQLWHTWERLSLSLPPVAPALVSRLMCSDADDQKFIEFALHHARWLVSRDRAVLKLARRAATFDLQIVTPEQWTFRQGDVAA